MTDKIIARARKPRVFQAIVPMTGYAHGELEDWPPKMQDAVYEAMQVVIERLGGRAIELVQCICIQDELGYHAKITVMEKLGSQDVVITHG